VQQLGHTHKRRNLELAWWSVITNAEIINVDLQSGLIAAATISAAAVASVTPRATTARAVSIFVAASIGPVRAATDAEDQPDKTPDQEKYWKSDKVQAIDELAVPDLSREPKRRQHSKCNGTS
jgi:hypothetical protein